MKQKIDIATTNLNGLTEALDIEDQFTSIWSRQMMESLHEDNRSIDSYLHHLSNNVLLLAVSDEVLGIRNFNLIYSEELNQ